MDKKKLFNRLSTDLKVLQSPSRFKHSLHVADLAARLGTKYGWDPDRARLAGLLHDWAKEWRPSKLIRYVRKHNLKIPDQPFILKNHPNLLHAYVSADVVRRQKWIVNESDLLAISSHTLGSLNMRREEKILYIADLASPDRRFGEVDQIRREAFRHLNRGFVSALALKIGYQLRKNKPIHPLPIKIWNNLHDKNSH
jgi:predicted HD superfamily hydrolase involved in NAD metabolism